MFPGLLSHILAVLDYIRYKFEWLSSFGEPSETYIPPQLAHNAPMSPKDKNILDTLNLLVLLYRAKKNPTNTLRRGRDSNPRNPLEVRHLSRMPHSTALPPLPVLQHRPWADLLCAPRYHVTYNEANEW